jgi:uroporphyrinogen decarboxylase
MDPTASTPFVAEALQILRKEVGPETAVLGFVGCPYTLATYLVEGKTSKEYLEIKKMAFNEPKLLHAILQNLADNIGNYALFQIENGAQLIQIFDSWAGHLSPRDYDEFAAPYQKQILDKVCVLLWDVVVDACCFLFLLTLLSSPSQPMAHC